MLLYSKSMSYTNASPEYNSSLCNLQYDSSDFKAVAAIQAVVGFLSLCGCVTVISLMVLFKRYKFFSLRLILYIAIAATIDSLSFTLTRVNFYTPRPLDEQYCNFGAIFNDYSALVLLVSIWTISFNVLVNGFFEMKTHRLEVVYLLLQLVLPLTFIWIGPQRQLYSAAAPFCSITFVDVYCKLSSSGVWYQFGIWFIPLYLSMTVILIMYGVMGLKLWRHSLKWAGHYDYEAVRYRNMLKDEVKPLFWYPIVFMVLNIFALINQIHNAVWPNSTVLWLWYLRVLITPLRDGFIALVYILCEDTRHHLKPSDIKAAVYKWWFKAEDEVQEYELGYYSIQDSLHSADNDIASTWN